MRLLNFPSAAKLAEGCRDDSKHMITIKSLVPEKLKHHTKQRRQPKESSDEVTSLPHLYFNLKGCVVSTIDLLLLLKEMQFKITPIIPCFMRDASCQNLRIYDKHILRNLCRYSPKP